MWIIELAYCGVAHYHHFMNGNDAEAFRKAAENATDERGNAAQVTLWYRGRSYKRFAATEIAHYYQRYTQSVVLYAPDGKAICEELTYSKLHDWAVAHGIHTVVPSEAEARHMNRGD